MLFIPLYISASLQVRIFWWCPSAFSILWGSLSVCAQGAPAVGVLWSPHAAAAAASQLLGYEALGIPQPPLLQFSSFDHFDVHRNLTMGEKYRSLLVSTTNFLGLISFWFFAVSSCRFYLQLWGPLSLCSFAFSYHLWTYLSLYL